MMKLILSLTLIWTLSSTAEALECYVGDGVDIKPKYIRQCDPTEMCATFAVQVNRNGEVAKNTVRMCLNSSIFSEGKHTFSFNVGFENESASVHVCNTDRCNSQVIPYSLNLTKNNLQCFGCDYPYSAVCNKAVQCLGEQDHCINATRVDTEGKTPHTFGCVSANLCEIAPFLKVTSAPIKGSKILHAPKCCGSSFCNSAWSVKLNVIPLLFGLITVINY
ncbi:phospholipase A2 inhibitor and Ly6/PLAUR domain-containing protein-like [Thunnus maccoyii]|uniref:phospholipase A2 inhibitor and Ly6/PLAUR domain-containing protein-like n=1 Tax=Thunnus maccoyii TaxID=8240 RepID=UPI001C4CCB1B|nr:phospholipase A2 inhibitor and Ly6/PLAUR domain-containing protein-like [Thunnus maccoyii]XP_042273299.1 phospholipase A2 inhibitor and Ly6/PLAUR domain-containing protein-like [Thunnus maccoyii]XP_042273300.1 phospholipase A2 inhibitor and Ly6/PLAUR domain-containing protein-like [Thunnus maccoyii]XP_042273301.1 phospholipase A2 inhibitor and Ly6/PLAUR domain-containing protein-like [Thunnus maccoyii]